VRFEFERKGRGEKRTKIETVLTIIGLDGGDRHQNTPCEHKVRNEHSQIETEKASKGICIETVCSQNVFCWCVPYGKKPLYRITGKFLGSSSIKGEIRSRLINLLLLVMEIQLPINLNRGYLIRL